MLLSMWLWMDHHHCIRGLSLGGGQDPRGMACPWWGWGDCHRVRSGNGTVGSAPWEPGFWGGGDWMHYVACYRGAWRSCQDGGMSRHWTRLLSWTQQSYNNFWKNYPGLKTENWIKGTPTTRDSPDWGRRGRNSLLERKKPLSSHSTSWPIGSNLKVWSFPWMNGGYEQENVTTISIFWTQHNWDKCQYLALLAINTNSE